jgi:hypothetical protein
MDAKMIMQVDFSFKEGREYIKVNFKEFTRSNQDITYLLSI